MKTIVIVGGGAAGLQLAIGLGRALGRKKRARVVLVDRSPTHLWKPLLHEVAAGSVEPTVHHTSFALQAERNHFEFIQGELVSVDRTSRVITVATGSAGETTDADSLHAIGYDKLVLAVGGVTQYFGVAGAREHALASTASAAPSSCATGCMRRCAASRCQRHRKRTRARCGWPSSAPARPASSLHPSCGARPGY